MSRAAAWAIVAVVCFGAYKLLGLWSNPWAFRGDVTSRQHAATVDRLSPSAAAALYIPGCADKPVCSQ